MRGIGIDFGAANSLLATFDGKAVNVKLAQEQPHSSIVWYKSAGNPCRCRSEGCVHDHPG